MMKSNKSLHKIFFFILACAGIFSCTDNPLLNDSTQDMDSSEGIFTDGYSLNFTTSLDQMGGGRAINTDMVYDFEYYENFIDLEKFRVLFFDKDDKFLFESKSRWVKRLKEGTESKWIVSVPLYTFGNDYYSENDVKVYNWERIRKSITSADFKIAILANRPELEWCDSFKDLDVNQKGWIDNTGPKWGPDQSISTYGDNFKTLGADTLKIKDVFDLHHCQFDPVYLGKSHIKSDPAGEYYDCIMGDYDATWNKDKNAAAKEPKSTMGATSTWVDWGDDGLTYDYRKVYDNNGSGNRRYFVHPSLKHPIPMYGIQKFEQIDSTKWQHGTPYNLSAEITQGYNDPNRAPKYKSISLLRSVVRLDLLIPKKLTKNGRTYDITPNWVAFAYPNIYARCEPMNVWDPTDEIWGTSETEHLSLCEEDRIKKHGPIATSVTQEGSLTYQQRLAWLYGAWLKKGWSFGKMGRTYVSGEKTKYGDFPNIFNPCIQRNSFVFADRRPDGTIGDLSNDGEQYWHYVVYTGERNINDPSNLYSMHPLKNGESNAGAGNSTIIYWIFKLNYPLANTVYALPITNYKSGYTASQIGTTTADEYLLEMNNNVNSYAVAVRNMSQPEDQRPYPLIRNHVYTMTLGATGTTAPNSKSTNESYPFAISCVESHTKSISRR